MKRFIAALVVLVATLVLGRDSKLPKGFWWAIGASATTATAVSTRRILCRNGTVLELTRDTIELYPHVQ